MGKFNLNKLKVFQEMQERKKEVRMKEALRARPLLETIPATPSKKNPLRDATLLFGKHRGKTILELLNSYDNSGYVQEYLATNKDLPSRVKKVVNEIIDNADPFGEKVDVETDIDYHLGSNSGGLKVREIFKGGDDIPWMIVLVVGISSYII